MTVYSRQVIAVLLVPLLGGCGGDRVVPVHAPKTPLVTSTAIATQPSSSSPPPAPLTSEEIGGD